MKITYTQEAWIDPKYTELSSLEKRPYFAMLSPCIPSGSGYMEEQGYCHIGTAQIELTLKSASDIVAGQLAGLNAHLAAVRAENQQKENAILLQISKLQALTMNADLEVPDDGQPF